MPTSFNYLNDMKKTVYVGNVPIGSGKIKIQSMTNTPTRDVEKTLTQINRLADAGADLIRISIPDEKCADVVDKLVQGSPVPLIGDIHYGEKCALIAIEKGIQKIRINPGNMSDAAIVSVVKKCMEYKVPVRVGINKGSCAARTPEELAVACLDTAKKIEDLGWDQLVLAVKTSDVRETVAAYEYLSSLSDHPLHIGLTEAGVGEMAKLRSSVAIGSLLLKGIGDTIRVSLAGDPVEEVLFAKKLLHATDIDESYVHVVACPTCSRTCIPVEEIALQLQNITENVKKPLKIAVMGCVVNGIGEGKDADFGIAGGPEKSILFVNGEQKEVVANDRIIERLLAMTEKYCYDE